MCACEKFVQPWKWLSTVVDEGTDHLSLGLIRDTCYGPRTITVPANVQAETGAEHDKPPGDRPRGAAPQRFAVTNTQTGACDQSVHPAPKGGRG